MSGTLNQVVLRDRNSQDNERVAEIALESLELHAASFSNMRPVPSADELTAEFDKQVARPDRYFRVADSAGWIVGFLTASLNPAQDGGIEYFAGPTVYVSDVAVTADARRRGVARLLMEDVENWGRDNRACAVTLSMHAGNPAHYLYESCGFQPTWTTYRKNL